MPDQRDARPAGPAFLAGLGPIVLINLVHRADRRAEFARELDKIGLSLDQVQVFPAMRPDDPAGFPSLGARGCFLSHLEVLRRAVAKGIDTVIVCEDDLDFARDFNRRGPEILKTLCNTPWDIVYGGYGSPPQGAPLDAAGQILRVPPETGIRCTHFLIFRGAVKADAITYLEAILARPPGHPGGGPMHVDGAFSRFRRDHPRYTTLAIVPPLGTQRASRTDIHDLRWFDRMPVMRDVMQSLRQIRRGLGRQGQAGQ